MRGAVSNGRPYRDRLVSGVHHHHLSGMTGYVADSASGVSDGFVPQAVLLEVLAGDLIDAFRHLGFIEYNGTLEVHSSFVNVVLHN